MPARKPDLVVRSRPSDVRPDDADAGDTRQTMRPSERDGRQVLRRSGDDIRRMTIRVPFDLGTAFVGQARAETRDISVLAAEAFQLYLDKHQAPRKRAKK